MATKKEKVQWLGHPVRDEEHQRELDLKAAIYQFHHGMDRAAAEHRVKHEDRVERHQKAAAHHLDGMRAAHAIGNHEDAQQHHAMYTLHVKALGHDPNGAVHPDIAKWQGDKAEKRAYTFKGHDDDTFLVQPVRETPPLAKAEETKVTYPKRDEMDEQDRELDEEMERSGVDRNTAALNVTKRKSPQLFKEEPPAEVIPIEEGHKVRELNQAVKGREDRRQQTTQHLDALRGAKTPDAIQDAKGKLLDYLKSLGIEGAEIQESGGQSCQNCGASYDPSQGEDCWQCGDFAVSPKPITAVSKPPLRVFTGTNTPTAPKFGHLRIVKHEEWPHLLNLWTDMAKDENGRQGRVKQFDVRKTWLRHRHLPEEKAFDYSSWLTPEQRTGGYRMFVLSHGNGNPVRVHVTHQNRKAGFATGNVDQGDLEVENYQLVGPHGDRGLEASMLNAMMGHAKQHMAADYLSHAPFTPDASGLIEAVAKPHGFQLGEPEDIVDGETPMNQPPTRAVSGGVKMRSQTQRTPRSFMPRIHRWWATEND